LTTIFSHQVQVWWISPTHVFFNSGLNTFKSHEPKQEESLPTRVVGEIQQTQRWPHSVMAENISQNMNLKSQLCMKKNRKMFG
jgi:rRNA maturation endonuclease Nob1